MKKTILLLLLLSLNACERQDDINPNVRQVKLYYAFATLPPMTFMVDVVKSPDTVKIIRENVRFDLGHMDQKYNTTVVESHDNFIAEVRAAIKKYPNAQFELHTAPDIHVPIHDILKLIPKERISRIHLYDEGTLDYLQLYYFKGNNTADQIKVKIDEATKNFFSVSEIKSLEYRYALANLYPVTYHMIRPDILTIYPQLKPIHDMISNVKSDFITLSGSLTDEERARYFEYLNYDPTKFDALFANSKNPKFVYTGTTTWEAGTDDRKYYADQQINVIKNLVNVNGDFYKYANGKTYDYALKLHPAGGNINELIRNAYPDMIEIPSSIGYEILIMANQLPEQTGGIMSSLYMSLPKDNIAFIVSTDQFPELETIYKDLGIITDSQIYNWKTITDLSTAP